MTIRVNTLKNRLEKRKLDVRAVRGPVTRAILMDYGYSVPEVYGDPAIIMPEIYKAVPLKNRKKYGLITHKDYVLNEKYEENKIARLNICTDDYQDLRYKEFCLITIKMRMLGWR